MNGRKVAAEAYPLSTREPQLCSALNCTAEAEFNLAAALCATVALHATLRYAMLCAVALNVQN